MSFQCFFLFIFFHQLDISCTLDTANDQFACQLQKYVFATLIILKYSERDRVNSFTPLTPTPFVSFYLLCLIHFPQHKSQMRENWYDNNYNYIVWDSNEFNFILPCVCVLVCVCCNSFHKLYQIFTLCCDVLKNNLTNIVQQSVNVIKKITEIIEIYRGKWRIILHTFGKCGRNFHKMKIHIRVCILN